MTRTIGGNPVSTAPRSELPSDLQRFTRIPVATWVKSTPNGPKEPVPGDLASFNSVFLDAGDDGKAMGIRLGATTLEEAIPAAQQVAEKTRYSEKDQYQEHETRDIFHVRVAPQAVLHAADGAWYAAPIDHAPAWSPDGKRAGPMELETDVRFGDDPAKPLRELQSVIAPAPELAAVVDGDRVWKTADQQDAIYPETSKR